MANNILEDPSYRLLSVGGCCERCFEEIQQRAHESLAHGAWVIVGDTVLCLECATKMR